MVRVHVKLRKIKFLTDPFSKYAIWDFHSKCNFSTDFDPIFIYLYIESVLIGSRFHFSFDSCRSYIPSRYTHTSFHTLFFFNWKIRLQLRLRQLLLRICCACWFQVITYTNLWRPAFYVREQFAFSCVCSNCCYEYVVRAGFRSLHTRLCEGV